MHTASAPCRTCAMSPSVDPSRWTYTDYVCFLKSHGFHNLHILDDYLEWGSRARSSPNVRQPEFSRTMLLEFSKTSTRISDLSDLNKLRLLLREWTSSTQEPTSPGLGKPSGRIIMIENAAPALIDTLGGLLNIDPMFFANHLDENTGPTSQDSHSIEYSTAFVPVNCPKDIEGSLLYSAGNYFRKVDLIPKQPRQKVALARRKISFYLRPNKEPGPWLAVVLVDPPVSSFTLGPTSFDNANPSQQMTVLPYQGGYVDFIEMRKPHSKQHHDFRDCQQNLLPNTFDDLIRHWQIQARDGLFLNNTPTLPHIMRPCLQLAAAETTNLFSYLSTTLTFSAPQTLITSNTALNTTTLTRALTRTITIDSLLSTLKPSLTTTKDFASSQPETASLYRSLLSTLHTHRSTCDAHLQHLTALLHLTSSTATSSLAAPVARASTHLRILLVLLLLAIPTLTACAVFALPESFAPSRQYLYIFLPVALAMSLLLVLLFLPEARERVLWAVKDRICGGLTRKKVLRGERFKRHRETGVREWVGGGGGRRERPGTRGTWGGTGTGLGTGSVSPVVEKRGVREGWDEV